MLNLEILLAIVAQVSEVTHGPFVHYWSEKFYPCCFYLIFYICIKLSLLLEISGFYKKDTEIYSEDRKLYHCKM